MRLFLSSLATCCSSVGRSWRASMLQAITVLLFIWCFLSRSWIWLYVLSAFVNNHNDRLVTLDLFGCTLLNVFKHNFNTLFPRCYLLSVHPWSVIRAAYCRCTAELSGQRAAWTERLYIIPHPSEGAGLNNRVLSRELCLCRNRVIMYI